ncbi:hypothetical protein CDL12_20190 [Handroanthus impetiginosus]|uniref:Membrane-associated kinase regulator 2 n=1 Tax=Handroanthus impetiginosus TaxID=429701 RepID=A0A2G9GPU7_9LAMI|nr:hypothetical protein CDL12_20190 [Handroanthus impetiginosus]
MEAFSLLKYWRTSGGGRRGSAGSATAGVSTVDANSNAATAETIIAAAASPDSSDGEDGPYFDLEFTLPDQETDTEEEPSTKSQQNDENALETENEGETESDSENDDDEEELKLAVASNDCTDQNMALSPSDELFFKGDLVSIEPSSLLLNNSEENSKIPVFLLKSATKFRVLLLKLKKSKSSNGDNLEKAEKSDKDEANDQVSSTPTIEKENLGKEVNSQVSSTAKTEKENLGKDVNVQVSSTPTIEKENLGKEVNGQVSSTPKIEKEKLGKEVNGQVSSTPKIEKENLGKVSSKFLAVKFKVEEVPLVSLFTRDSSSKENNGKGVKHNVEDSDERKLTKEVVQKYLKMVKPFYVRVSKRYVEKLKFSGHLSLPGGGSKGGCTAAPEKEAEDSPPQSNVKTQIKQGKNLQAGLKIVGKHLVKSRSASATVAAAPPGKTTSNRLDDSLVQLQDGIQGAILHCKRSLNASRDIEESSSMLSRSVSDPSYEKSVMMPKVSSSSATSSRFGEAKETN